MRLGCARTSVRFPRARPAASSAAPRASRMAPSCPRHLGTFGPFRSGSASPGCGVVQLSASMRKAAARLRAGALGLA
eukprot:13292345-Alexandrium_andersonii.AAC.1